MNSVPVASELLLFYCFSYYFRVKIKRQIVVSQGLAILGSVKILLQAHMKLSIKGE